MNIQKYTLSHLVLVERSPESLGVQILSRRFRGTKIMNAGNVPHFDVLIMRRTRAADVWPDPSRDEPETFEREQINFTECIEFVREDGKIPMVANFDWGTSDKTNVIAYRVTRWMTQAEMLQDRFRA